MKEIELEKSLVCLADNGIMHIHIKTGSDLQLRDAELIATAISELGMGKKYPVLIDAGVFSSIDNEARVFSASMRSNIYIHADAIAYCHLAQRLMAQFYLKHNKPLVPTSIFSDKIEAVDWLGQFLQKSGNQENFYSPAVAS